MAAVLAADRAAHAPVAKAVVAPPVARKTRVLPFLRAVAR